MNTRNQVLVGVASVLLLSAFVSREAAVDAPRFMIDPLWPKPLPNHWLMGSTTGVAVDSRDHVFVVNLKNSFSQGNEILTIANPGPNICCFPAPEILEFDPAGNLVGHWNGGTGYDWPTVPSGLAIDAQDNIWLGGGGVADAQILKFTRDGKFLLQSGKPAASAAATPPAANPGRGDTSYGGGAIGGVARGGTGNRGGRGGGSVGPIAQPAGNSGAMDSFGAPSRFAFDATANEIFVADGYRNRRVAVIDAATGKIKRIFGAYGKAPSDADATGGAPGGQNAPQFRAVSCVALSKDNLLYVCDRQNNRIQVFQKNGTFVKEMQILPKTLGEGSVWDIAFSRDPQQRFVYVADGANARIHIVDRQSLEVLTTFGDGGRYPGQFLAVHSIATDSKGNIYTTETYQGKRLQKFTYQGLGPVTKKDQGTLRANK